MKQAIPPVHVVIFTPLAVERKAVVRHLNDLRQEIRDGDLYETGTFQGLHQEYTVVVRETGPKNANLALATEKAIRRFQPLAVLLVGIAGGVKDAGIGDIVVGTKAYGYESGKETGNGAVSRPDVLPYSKELIEVARMVSRDQEWRKRTADGAPGANIYFGPIASGDKVIATTASPLFHFLKQHYNDTLALEMESIGFAQAVFPHRAVHALNIRAVSDLLDHKSGGDESERQQITAERAAAFAFELLNQLDTSTLIFFPMELKDLVKEVYTLLFPAALNEIKKDFADATNNEIRTIWKKVKPLFITEVEALAKAPDDVVAQSEVIGKLKQGLEADAGLKTELEKLLEQAKTQVTTVSVVNSKNVVAGSTISVGGDFRVGDGKD
ncbi:MAG: hypothetical protein DYG98_22315 [Haliscomenobacteraceae bacterium CHB4]|nr:5'-methylthioadenosine/S-adenosylhomocysteine nucleosidase [Saprospiraceae bacterium]MCE7925795.1 hypothetical protein [Haliscomenobacteraceae bacterium CHB4]